MIPMIETRGAIPVATSLGMNVWLAYIISCVSALIVCPLLVLFLKPILGALKKTKGFKKLANAVEITFREKAEKIEQDAEQDLGEEILTTKDDKKKIISKAIGLYLFVAIPLPMTGVWTGSAVAAFIDLKYRYSFSAIILGNFTAGLIITVLNIFLKEYAILILLVLAVFMLISIVSLIIGFVVKYKKIKNQKNIIEEK
jgi:uncharacterized membrane protein